MPYQRAVTWLQRAPNPRTLGLDGPRRRLYGGMGQATDTSASGGYTTITTPSGDYQVFSNGDVYDPNGNVIHTAATALESNMTSGINYLTALLGTQGSSGSLMSWVQANQGTVLLIGGGVLLLAVLKGMRS